MEMEIKSKYSMSFFLISEIIHQEFINIQRREVDLNIILPKVNNFDSNKKKTRSICFIIWHQHQTRSGKVKAIKTQEISVKTQVFL